MSVESVQEFDRCLHGKAAPCTGECPFSMDVRDFVNKLQRGRFGPAYNSYRTAVAFPALVSRLCSAPCGSKCGAKLSLPLLERSTIDFTRSKDPVCFSLPKQDKRVAVVGASLGGLACALRLAEKQYSVTIFESDALPGGSARSILPWEEIEEELRLQFQYVSCAYIPNHPIENAAELAEQFDAVYLASGVTIPPLGRNVFAAGKRDSSIAGLAAGLKDYQQILWFLQTGTEKPGAPLSFRPGFDAPIPSPEAPAPVIPGNGNYYSKAQARQEAARCTGCNCSACIDSCVLLQQYGQSPVNLARDIGISTNMFPETQGHAAMREIGSCSDCGLCKEVCPVGIDIGKIIMNARRILRDRQELPPAHHGYWLRDMAFANSPEAAVFHLPESGKCGYLFFPGCQSGGSDPRYVTMTYQRLQACLPNTGLLLRCCGAPAFWAGEQELFQHELNVLRQYWLDAGKPTLLLSCPSCYRTLRDHLPEIPVKMIYELETVEPAGIDCYETAAVFDPCASRNYPELQVAVRNIARKCHLQLEERVSAQNLAQCCSWGGHGYCVNKLYVKQQVQQQSAESSLPYICYCTNCRDIFAARGKDCRHILDYILGINPAPRPAPTVTERRGNRRNLKQMLAAAYQLPEPITEAKPSMTLHMSQAVRAKINDDLILEEDLCAVIAECEKTKRYLENPENGHLIGHCKLGYLTYWVEFSKSDAPGYTIYNAYAHRMSIKHEEM